MSQSSPRRDSSSRLSLEAQLEADAAVDAPRGKGTLFTLPPGAAEAASARDEPAAEVVAPRPAPASAAVDAAPEPEPPAAPAVRVVPTSMRPPTPAHLPRPVRSTTVLDERSHRGAGLAKGTYVVSERHDRMLRELSTLPDPPVPLEELARQALDSYFVVTGLDGDLQAMDRCPVPNPQQSEPGMIRLTIRIWPRQATVLRRAKVLFSIEASEIVRQAIERYYRHRTGQFID